jgi:hypothetical protein
MPEQLPLADYIEHPPVVDEFDRAREDHSHGALRRCSLLEDRRAGSELLAPCAPREPLADRGADVVEGRVGLEEPSQIAHDDASVVADARGRLR